ncbi:hypothetical protein GDO86_011716 [Hymenochirus boettgeri]|uniref:Secreted protein n=1 Tax=Hymenochirus boettgeri TaxID=247094 RepID=A0A8T2JK66_9PIPI|nr:hypothetical protein GDO86_011716 [Hymenochirus boettgeri]
MFYASALSTMWNVVLLGGTSGCPVAPFKKMWYKGLFILELYCKTCFMNKYIVVLVLHDHAGILQQSSKNVVLKYHHTAKY